MHTDPDPVLDDAVERGYGFETLVDTAYAGRITAALMMAGAVEPPSLPVTSPELDPAQVLDDGQEQLRRRLEQISPAAGRHFVGMWQAVVERDRRVTAVPEAFHNAREMVSALNEVLLAVATARAEHGGESLPPLPDDGRATEAWKLSVLVGRLGLSAELAAEQKRLRLHRVAHRDGLGAPRRVTEEMIDLARSAERVATALADLYERHIGVVFAEIDRMLTASASAAEAERLAHLAAPDHEVIRSFFDRLDDPAWSTALNGQKFFDDPPAPVAALIHPRWPQSRYLARIAGRAKAPADLAVLLQRIGAGTANVRIHEDLLRAATVLPPAYAARILAAEPSWPMTHLHQRVARLVGEREIIRYPAWLAGLQLHVATHPDSAADARTAAADALRRLLRVGTDLATEEINDEEINAAEITTAEIDDEALLHVLRHLREHGTQAGRDLVARMLAENIEEISRALAETPVEEMPDPMLYDDGDLAASDPALEALLRWFTGDATASDRSHLVLPSWLGRPPPRGSVALAGLMTGLTDLLVDIVARGGDPARIRPDAVDPAVVGLWDRARLAALSLVEGLPATVIEEALADPRLARVAVVREEYALLLQRAWGDLDDAARHRIRDALGSVDEPDPVRWLIARALLAGLDSEAPSEEALVAEARAVTGRPRILLSIARGAPDPWADQEVVAAEHRTGPVRDLSLVRAQELLARERPPSPDEWAEVLEAVAPRILRRSAPREATRARWLAVAARWVGDLGPSRARVRDRLARVSAGGSLRWSAAGAPRRANAIGHDGLEVAESSSHAQALLLRITLLTRCADDLTPAQRARIVSSLRRDLGARSAMRPTLLTVLGFLLPSIHAQAPEVWAELIAPLLRDPPELPRQESGSPEAALPPRAQDLAALYSGLMMRPQPARPAFVVEIRPFLVWVYENLRALSIPGGMTPSPLVTHGFAMILGELAYEQ